MRCYSILLMCGHSATFTSDELPDDYNLSHDAEFYAPCIYCGTEQLVVMRTEAVEAIEDITRLPVIFQ